MKKKISDIDQAIGKHIRLLRTAQGLSMKRLEKISGVSQPYISEVERGQKSISVKRLIDICTALSMRLDEFYNTLEIEKLPNNFDTKKHPEYNRIIHLAKLLDKQELKITLQVMEKLIENRTSLGV
ncbi:transcriptional regulator with XRE-family HTH domain [Desulfohalotomaculum tongense]|uniref:helix-turn-helix domain-containing protein n=1 Tax=Desulforadius tongensis TaxID=1216062 RepID=UPI0019571822|nr:helix-turn-helix transcriptional regulator [Desulforadius tongensis]MBM7853656.1 transcriptional regulator with XRE-family HTH domain [Desulforadius tongensis]